MSEISDIFAKTPPHTAEDLDKIIAAQRAARAQYALSGKVTKTKAAKVRVDLDSLDI